jgi:hypothetical protein
MSLCLRFVRAPAGSWSVHGLADRPVAHLPSLAASVDYARRECAAASATIELVIGEFYAVVHQKDGWPRRLVGPEFDACHMAAKEPGDGARSLFGHWCDWVAASWRG